MGKNNEKISEKEKSLKASWKYRVFSFLEQNYGLKYFMMNMFESFYDILNNSVINIVSNPFGWVMIVGSLFVAQVGDD